MPTIMVKILHRECIKRWPDRGEQRGMPPVTIFRGCQIKQGGSKTWKVKILLRFTIIHGRRSANIISNV